jgi:hypothetical protein
MLVEDHNFENAQYDETNWLCGKYSTETLYRLIAISLIRIMSLAILSKYIISERCLTIETRLSGSRVLEERDPDKISSVALRVSSDDNKWKNSFGDDNARKHEERYR